MSVESLKHPFGWSSRADVTLLLVVSTTPWVLTFRVRGLAPVDSGLGHSILGQRLGVTTTGLHSESHACGVVGRDKSRSSRNPRARRLSPVFLSRLAAAFAMCAGKPEIVLPPRSRALIYARDGKRQPAALSSQCERPAHSVVCPDHALSSVPCASCDPIALLSLKCPVVMELCVAVLLDWAGLTQLGIYAGVSVELEVLILAFPAFPRRPHQSTVHCKVCPATQLLTFHCQVFCRKVMTSCQVFGRKLMTSWGSCLGRFCERQAGFTGLPSSLLRPDFGAGLARS